MVIFGSTAVRLGAAQGSEETEFAFDFFYCFLSEAALAFAFIEFGLDSFFPLGDVVLVFLQIQSIAAEAAEGVNET